MGGVAEREKRGVSGCHKGLCAVPFAFVLRKLLHVLLHELLRELLHMLLRELLREMARRRERKPLQRAPT